MADNFNTLDQQASVDPFQVVQGNEERQTADGENFLATIVKKAVADAASVEVLIKVGASAISIATTASIGGISEAFLFEGPTVTANGTAIPIFDSNRNTANTPITTIFDGPTTTADGTQIANVLLQAGEKEKGITATEQGNRLILATNTDYLLRVTNNSGGSIDLSLAFDFNEPAQ